jgi:hypothetical protein
VLRETEGFERLKVNLAEEDQREAGVVTRAGLLVNGNTRAAALRDIDKQYIRVAVLPGTRPRRRSTTGTAPADEAGSQAGVHIH